MSKQEIALSGLTTYIGEYGRPSNIHVATWLNGLSTRGSTYLLQLKSGRAQSVTVQGQDLKVRPATVVINGMPFERARVGVATTMTPGGVARCLMIDMGDGKWKETDPIVTAEVEVGP